MGFPDMLTLAWAKNKYGGGGTSGIPVDIAETIAEWQNDGNYAEHNGMAKISDTAPTAEQMETALAVIEIEDEFEHAVFAVPLTVVASDDGGTIVTFANTINFLSAHNTSLGERMGLYIAVDEGFFGKNVWLVWPSI